LWRIRALPASQGRRRRTACIDRLPPAGVN